MGDADVGGFVPFPGDSCLFPALNTISVQSQDAVEEYVPIDLEKKDQIRKFCNSQGIELPQLLQLTWAIVLRTYTGSKSPLFRYVDGKKTGLLCSLDLSEKHETAFLAKDVLFREDAAMERTQHCVNTAVTWNTGKNGHAEQVRSRERLRSSDAEKPHQLTHAPGTH